MIICIIFSHRPNTKNISPLRPFSLIVLWRQCTQGQINSVYFDLSRAFGIVPRNLLTDKISHFRFSSGYVI
jgi:hypothetical protein